MSRRNSNRSRESIIFNNCKENLTGVLMKFQTSLNTTLKRESMKKTLAIEEAKSNFNFLSKIKNDMKEKLKRDREERQYPIQKLRDQFRDMTDFKEKYDKKFKGLEDKVKMERVRKDKLLVIYNDLREKVQLKLKAGTDLDKSMVHQYTQSHESKIKQTAKLQRLINQQLSKQRQLEKQYLSKKQKVAKSKQILSSINTRISEANIHRKMEQVMKEVSQNQRLLTAAKKLLYESKSETL